MSAHAAWLVLLVIATTVDGLLAGASLDQSIEQLPARHRIGARACSAYSRASHVGNGRFWLAPLGIGGALLTLAAAIESLKLDLPAWRSNAVLLAGALAVAHTLSTVKAASVNLTQWKPDVDDGALARILQRYERWQALRAGPQFLTFAAMVWGLSVNAHGGS